MVTPERWSDSLCLTGWQKKTCYTYAGHDCLKARPLWHPFFIFAQHFWCKTTEKIIRNQTVLSSSSCHSNNSDNTLSQKMYQASYIALLTGNLIICVSLIITRGGGGLLISGKLSVGNLWPPPPIRGDVESMTPSIRGGVESMTLPIRGVWNLWAPPPFPFNLQCHPLDK